MAVFLMAMLVQRNKSLVLILVKQWQNFAWAYITIMIVAICLLTDKKSISLKATIKNINFPTKFSLGNIPNKFDVVDSKEVSLKISFQSITMHS